MRWLKSFDWFSKCLVKDWIVKSSAPISRDKSVCILRPGGLGDLVLLTRACLSLGVDPKSVQWVVEKRNGIWLDYLGIPYLRYDDPGIFFQVLFGKYSFKYVINSEQTFGLASLFAVRLCAKEGKVIGFESNIRSDLYDQNLEYTGQSEHELTAFIRLLKTVSAELKPLDNADYFQFTKSSDQKYFVVVLGGLQVKEKRLSLEKWAKLIEKFTQPSQVVMLVGANDDREFSLKLEKKVKLKLQNLVGLVPFAGVVDLIRGAERVVGVDSGLIHVADFFNVPADVVFIAGKEKKWGPLTEGSRVFSKVKEDGNNE